MARNCVASIWPEADDKLRTAWEAGVPVADIGRRFGVTPGSITGRAHRLGLPRHSSRAHYNLPPPKPRVPRVYKPRVRPTPAPKPPKPAVRPPEPPLPAPTIRGRCQWISGDDRASWRFCDAPASAPGSPWCAEHRRVVFYRARPAELRAEGAE